MKRHHDQLGSRSASARYPSKDRESRREWKRGTPSASFDVNALATIEPSVSLGGRARNFTLVAVLKLQGAQEAFSHGPRADEVRRALDGERVQRSCTFNRRLGRVSGY